MSSTAVVTSLCPIASPAQGPKAAARYAQPQTQNPTQYARCLPTARLTSPTTRTPEAAVSSVLAQRFVGDRVAAKPTPQTSTTAISPAIENRGLMAVPPGEGSRPVPSREAAAGPGALRDLG